MYLVDSSVLLEGLLLQERADEVKQFLLRAPAGSLYLSDFSLHSIGLILTRAKLHDVFVQFVEDTVVRGFLRVLSLPAEALPQAVKHQLQHALDFDDAYQYALAELYGLTIVSFDADFDRTPKGRKQPYEALQQLT